MTSANDKKTDANIEDSQTDNQGAEKQNSLLSSCLLYTSDAADE